MLKGGNHADSASGTACAGDHILCSRAHTLGAGEAGRAQHRVNVVDGDRAFERTAGQRRQVENFLTTAGMDMVNDEIPWAGNVLPFLEAKLQAADKVFGVRLNEKGYVDRDGLVHIPEYMITPEMLGETEKPAKKAPAKSRARKATRK